MSSPLSRPAELSDSTHHGGWIIIVSAILLVLLVLCLALRGYVRTTYSTIAGSPDHVLAVAGVLSNRDRAPEAVLIERGSCSALFKHVLSFGRSSKVWGARLSF